MNNSSRKSNLINLFNNLSETSNDYLTEINQNLKRVTKLHGGSHTSHTSHTCPCIDAHKAFNDENHDLALYILKEKNCCYCCTDDNGNTLLHHIVLCCRKHNNNNKCMSALTNALRSSNVSDFINIQNSDGTTPILLAVETENEVVANKLDEAGADKSIADNTGNYLQTEDMSEPEHINMSETPNEQVCINNVVKLVVNDNKKTESDLSSLNLSSLINNSNNSNGTISSDDSDIIAEKVKNKIVETFGINNKPNDVSSLELTSSDNYLDSDKFIKFLSNKYNKEDLESMEEPQSINELMGNSDLTSSFNLTHDLNLVNETTSQDDSSEQSLNSEAIINALTEKLSHNLESKSEPIHRVIDIDDSIDTDVLMKAIDNIQSGKKTNNVNFLEGGAKAEKIMGYRKLMLHSEDSDNNNYTRANENSIRQSNKSKLSKYSKKSNDLSINLDLYYSDGETGVSNNELSRLINSRKNDLHNEVINMILGMLNKGSITKNSKPVEASERNAKLIKSFLYRIVSEKNPQLTGMDKILMIKKMNDKEIIDSLTKMPDLDELEENIRKHIEAKEKSRETKNETTDDSDSSESKPKKKTSKKVKQSRGKKVSKQSSKNASKKASKKTFKKTSKKTSKKVSKK
jgi:hypothetical protein